MSERARKKAIKKIWDTLWVVQCQIGDIKDAMLILHPPKKRNPTKP